MCARMWEANSTHLRRGGERRGCERGEVVRGGERML